MGLFSSRTWQRLYSSVFSTVGFRLPFPFKSITGFGICAVVLSYTPSIGAKIVNLKAVYLSGMYRKNANFRD